MMVKGSKEIEFEQSSLVAGFRIYTKPQKSFGRYVFYRKPNESCALAKYQDVPLTPRMTKELQFIELLQLLDSERELIKNDISFEHEDAFY
jgi:hypothetical protein